MKAFLLLLLLTATVLTVSNESNTTQAPKKRPNLSDHRLSIKQIHEDHTEGRKNEGYFILGIAIIYVIYVIVIYLIDRHYRTLWLGVHRERRGSDGVPVVYMMLYDRREADSDTEEDSL